MKKSWIIILILFVFLGAPAYAEKILANSLDDLSSLTPSFEYSIALDEDFNLKNGQIIEKNSIFKGKIINVVSPQRLKKDAYFIFIPESYTIPSQNNKEIPLKKRLRAKIKYYEDFELPDKKQIAKATGVTVAGILVPGLDFGINFVEGATKAKEGEGRFKAGCRGVVESWPICYCLKGNEIEIKAGSKVLFYFDKEIFY